MQGELGTTPLGNPLVGAGMIRRVLSRLFNQSARRVRGRLQRQKHLILNFTTKGIVPVTSSRSKISWRQSETASQ